MSRVNSSCPDEWQKFCHAEKDVREKGREVTVEVCLLQNRGWQVNVESN